MKKIFFLLLVVLEGFAHCLAAEAIDTDIALDILQKAFQKSSQSSYVAELKNLKFPEFPDVKRTVFYRQYTENGKLRLRAELYGVKGLLWIFLQNEDGKFAICPPDNLIAKGGDFLRLYYLEEMFHQPYWGELKKCSYQSRASERNGRKLQVLTAKTPGLDRTTETDDDKVFFMIVTENWNAADTCADIKKTHPFVREYTIDEALGTIVALRKFNWYGETLCNFSLGNLEWQPDWEKYPDCFKTPEKIDFTVATTGQFMKLMQLERRSAARGKSQRQSRRGNLASKSFWNLTYIRYILLSLGLVLAGGSWWFRHRSGD